MPPENAQTAQYKTSAPPSRAPSGQPAVRGRRQTEGADAPLIPDTCNIGIILRSLLAVNLPLVLAAVAHATDGLSLVSDLLRLAFVLEPAALASLAALCVARRAVNGSSLRTQWLVAIGVPVAVTGVVAVVVAHFMHAGMSAPQLLSWAAVRMVIAGFLAVGLTEYFRLRARAYSPSFSEARLQALQARIRPHFLFNSLNAVLGLMRSDPRRAETTLENIASLFRVFMRDARELVPLDDEVVTCKEYLAIEQLRLGERLCIAWHLEEMPGDALLPSLLLQPLIENAVHHGIEPSIESGTIEISAVRIGERVRVEILNPIPEAASPRAGNQMALSNVRERLMLLYDMEAELRTNASGGTFRLELEFPYRKERRRRDVRRHFDPDR